MRLRSYLIVLLLIPWTGLMATCAGIMCIFSRRVLPTFIMRAWAWGWLKMAGIDLDIEGLENVDPERPSIYMANHASVIDIPVLIWALPVDLRFIFKQSIIFIPLLGLAIWMMGMIPINRSNRTKAKQSLKKAGERIRNGSHVLIFPEGTRSDGTELLPFKKGGFYLALQEHIDIIPISIFDSPALCDRNSVVSRKGTIKVQIHPRYELNESSIENRAEVIQNVRDIINSSFEGRTNDQTKGNNKILATGSMARS